MTNRDRKERRGGSALVNKGHIQEHLHRTEAAVRSLKDELRVLREQNNTITRQRDELLRQSSTQDEIGKKEASLPSVDLRMLTGEQNKLTDALQFLRTENRTLKNRCTDLEEALTDERRKLSEARSVILYLEAQIEQLESMVAELRGHKRFMKELGRHSAKPKKRSR